MKCDKSEEDPRLAWGQPGGEGACVTWGGHRGWGRGSDPVGSPSGRRPGHTPTAELLSAGSHSPRPLAAQASACPMLVTEPMSRTQVAADPDASLVSTCRCAFLGLLAAVLHTSVSPPVKREVSDPPKRLLGRQDRMPGDHSATVTAPVRSRSP